MTTSYDAGKAYNKAEQQGRGTAIGEANRRSDDIMFPEIMGKMVMGKFWEHSFLPDVTNTSLFNGVTPTYGRKVRFIREPEIIVNWRERNDPIKHDALRLNDFEVEIGREADWSYKINDYDYDALWNSAEYQRILIEGSRKAMQAELQKRVIRYMMARVACENTGNFAGINGDYCLGDYALPYEITPQNMTLPFQMAHVMMAERNLTTDNLNAQMGMGDLFALVPPVFSGMLMDSKIVDRKLMGQCEGACETLRDGGIDNYAGFDIYSTNCLPKITFADGSFGYPILMGAKGATGFTGMQQKVRIVDNDKDDWGVYVQGKFVTGYEVFWPEALIMFIARFKWDGAQCVAV